MADRDAYCLLNSRETNPLWNLPHRPVEPTASSRMGDANCPDLSAIPPDDPSANEHMRHPFGFQNHRYYDQFQSTDSVEQYQYLDLFEKDPTGQVLLSPEIAIDLSLIHNRDYQTQFEQIYLNALSLSGNRFEFATQWSGGNGGSYVADGQAPNDSRLLSLSDRLGLQQQFARGGQIAVNLANSLAWQFSDGQFSSGNGSVVALLTLPLLRGACTYVRLEGLVQAERDLLYQVRNFARFRRQFYFDVTNSYYSLLGQVQSIRNTRINLESLELNLREHQELLARKMVSQIQVDQVFQDYQNGRLSLLSSEQSLANSLDNFKFQLGLPTWLGIKVDESLLQPFEFNSSELEKIQKDADELFLELLTFLPPNSPNEEQAAAFFDRYEGLLNQLNSLFPDVYEEFEKWNQRLENFDEDQADADDRLDWVQQKQIARQLNARISDLKVDLGKDIEGLEATRAETMMPPVPEEKFGLIEDVPPLQDRRWDRLQHLVGRRLREQIAELFVAQVQSRVFSIDLEPVELSQETAIQYALENRLDLMNTRAGVIDSFRRVEVAANALRSQLDVTAQANLGTDPNRTNLVGFDSSANSYQIGVEFDGPLNRFNERNAYRATQIAYQQSRRQYMAAEDAIVNTIRSDLRQLRIQRLNFQIARQQLIAATRQVDEAQFNLRTAAQSSTNLTRDLLQALQGLLNSKNNLIGSWIGYKTSRITLFVDLELLYLDENGKWINEQFSLNELGNLVHGMDQLQQLSETYFVKRSPLFESTQADLDSDSLSEAPASDDDANGRTANDLDSHQPSEAVESDENSTPLKQPDPSPNPLRDQ